MTFFNEKQIWYFEQHPESLPYLNRLIKEWTKNEKIILSCDFDDTIRKWNLEVDYSKAINLLIKAKEIGAYIVIFTASDYIKRESTIRNHCKEIGLEIDEINKNPIDLPFGHHGKIYANLYVDDRSGLNETLMLLETAIDYKLYLKTKQENEKNIN